MNAYARSSVHSAGRRVSCDDFMNGVGPPGRKKPPVGQLVPVDSDNCERSAGDQRAKRADISLLAY